MQLGDRHGGIKTGGINLCKKGEMMVFESAKGIWYAISRKSNENVTPKIYPKIILKHRILSRKVRLF